MNKILTTVLLLVMLAAFGCFHGEKITKIQPGMSVAQVKSIMGPQEGYKKFGKYEVYSYYNKLISGWAWDKADYHYVFSDGILIEYGAGEIRQNQNTGVVFIVPLK